MTTNMLSLSRPFARALPVTARYFDPQEMRQITSLATPIALVAVVNMAISITDTFMVAMLGPTPMAAVAVSSDFYSILFYMATGLLSGLCPAYAEAWAAKDADRLARLRSVGWALLAVAALPVVPLIWFAPDYLCWLGISPELLAESRGYSHALAFTCLPMLAMAFLRNRLTAIEKPKRILRITLAAIPLNAALNWLLIFGFGGWEGLGTTGAGIASFLSASFAAAGLFVLTWREGDRGMARHLDIAEFKTAMRVGWPIGVATLAEVGIFLGATLYIAAIAVDEAAAHALVLRLAGLTYAIPVGLLQASMVRMARLGGTARRSQRRRVMTSATLVALASGVALFAALAAVAYPLAHLLLGSTPQSIGLVQTAALLVVILGVIELIEPLGTTSAGLLRGRRDTRMPMLFSLIGNWGVSLPLGLALTLVLDLGATGVWVAMGIGNITASLLIFSRLARHWRA